MIYWFYLFELLIAVKYLGTTAIKICTEIDTIRNINTKLSLIVEGIITANMNEANVKNVRMKLKLIFIPSLAIELLRTSLKNKPTIIAINALYDESTRPAVELMTKKITDTVLSILFINT